MAYAFSQQVGFHNCFSPALNVWTAADCLWLPDASAVSCHVVASFFGAEIE
jgi:hypothetical protein